MESANWQTIVAGLCVVGAVIVLARRVTRMWSSRSGAGCGPAGCGSCPSNELSFPVSSQPGEIVPLESLMAREEPGEN